MQVFPEDISLFSLVQFALLLITPTILILTFRRNTTITTLGMCHELGERHMELMWLTVDKPELNGVWERFTESRFGELEEAQSQGNWGAWHIMNEEERACYRFTRRALEHVEQAYDAHENGWMPDHIWKTWQLRLNAWKNSDYSRFVLGDLGEFKDTDFFKAIQQR